MQLVGMLAGSSVSRKVVFFLMVVLFLLVGCATFRGVAEDTESLARGMKRTISEDETSSRRQTR